MKVYIVVGCQAEGEDAVNLWLMRKTPFRFGPRMRTKVWRSEGSLLYEAACRYMDGIDHHPNCNGSGKYTTKGCRYG